MDAWIQRTYRIARIKIRIHEPWAIDMGENYDYGPNVGLSLSRVHPLSCGIALSPNYESVSNYLTGSTGLDPLEMITKAEKIVFGNADHDINASRHV